MQKDLTDRMLAKCDVLTKTAANAAENYEAGMLRLSKELRGLRKEGGVGLKQLAGAMDISACYLSDLERGRRTLNQSILRKFVLNVDILSNGKHK